MMTGWPADVPYVLALTCPEYTTAAYACDDGNPNIEIAMPIAEDTAKIIFVQFMKTPLVKAVV
jgi:hypothetical protein